MNPYTQCNQVQLIHGGKEFFSTLLHLINGARSSIHLQTYIFDADQTGTAVAEALIEAAQRKVEVYLLVDGYASRDLPEPFINKMLAAGVHFRFFEPLFKSNHFYFGRRLHHKVFVADARYALVSGTNIADRYNDLPGAPAWLDFALLVEGEVAIELYNICSTLWEKHEGSKLTAPQVDKSFLGRIAKHDYCAVRITRNDWIKGENQIWKMYYHLFRNARHRITIMCSYFLPGTLFRLRLSRTAKKGVKVRVILAGTSDVALSKYAERYLYRWMLRHGIEVYEYQPAVLHAKVAVADDDHVTVGSYNINDISAYASVELNLDVKNKRLAGEMEQKMDAIIKRDCLPITPAFINLFSLRHLLYFFSYYLVRLLITVSTFYYKQEE